MFSTPSSWPRFTSGTHIALEVFCLAVSAASARTRAVGGPMARPGLSGAARGCGRRVRRWTRRASPARRVRNRLPRTPHDALAATSPQRPRRASSCHRRRSSALARIASSTSSRSRTEFKALPALNSAAFHLESLGQCGVEHPLVHQQAAQPVEVDLLLDRVDAEAEPERGDRAPQDPRLARDQAGVAGGPRGDDGGNREGPDDDGQEPELHPAPLDHLDRGRGSAARNHDCQASCRIRWLISTGSWSMVPRTDARTIRTIGAP